MPEIDLRSYGKSEASRLLHQQASGHHRLYLFSALRSIERGDFATAVKTFERVDAVRGEDGPSRLLAARCKALIDAGPPDDWQPVIETRK